MNLSVSMHDAIEVIEEAFRMYAKQDFISPDRVFSQVKDENTFMLIPCYVDDCIGLKIVTVVPTNIATNEPVTQGVIIINDRETGKPLSYEWNFTYCSKNSGSFRCCHAFF